ncbi:MAG: ERF family protein [Pseudooceanicola sp.]|nr:ERF family protein [Pseudooceanicola sp.]|tara:strand:+ start:919 stop:1692 length:774 start_codon:yes stop_codon:yes gene_type:complete
MSEATQIVERENTSPALKAGQAVTPAQMLMVAVERGADMEKLEKLMDLQERWEAKESRKAFDNAIALARAEIKPIVKTAEVDFTSQKGRTNYKHETLDGIAQQIDPILSKFGLSYRFRSKQEGGGLHVTCVVAHRDGHSEETTLFGPPDNSGNKNGYQAVGSAATYLQRYTLKLALGLSATKDDDGQGQNAQPQQQPTVSPEQIKQLRDAMTVAGVPESEFLGMAAVGRIEEMEQRRVTPALSRLKSIAEGKANAGN